MLLQYSDLSSEHEATTGSNNSHGGDSSMHVQMSPLFAPAAATPLLLQLPPVAQAQLLELEAAAPDRCKNKKKRSLPGHPEPGAEVIALSPRTLVATNRFVCEVCNKGFQRDQNLQLHRRGHNLPWKLRQRALPSSASATGVGGAGVPAPRKRVYVCPEASCVHHDPARALGDLTGIKKHYSRKHGEKRWRCDRCGKRYAVHSDWKAHAKNCGTREYRCHCGILFSRKDSLLTHRAFCDALAEESARLLAAANTCSTITTCNNIINNNSNNLLISTTSSSPLFLPFSNPPPAAQNPNPNPLMFLHQEAAADHHGRLFVPPSSFRPSATPSYLGFPTIGAMATTITSCSDDTYSVAGGVVDDTVRFGLTPEGSVTLHAGGHCLTRDFLGVQDTGEVEELDQLPLCAAASCQGCSIAATAAAVSRAASCGATDLTRQYLGRLPPVNETWSHNF